jgi:ribonuclease-3
LALRLPFISAKKSEKDLVIIKFIIQNFGYRPTDVNIFKKALRHKSLSSGDLNSNERLEFLGDAILDAVVAEYLYNKFPGDDEGYLTKLKSKIVNRKTLSEIGEKMGLREVIKYSQSRTINLSAIEGNAFEALIGAIYLDGGFNKAKASLQNFIFRKFVDINKLLEVEIDFKSRLFIWCQKKRLNLEFVLHSEENIEGSWLYTIRVAINKKEYGEGKGSTKKEAEQLASKETLQLMGEI